MGHGRGMNQGLKFRQMLSLDGKIALFVAYRVRSVLNFVGRMAGKKEKCRKTRPR